MLNSEGRLDISVVIPVYNSGKTVIESIASVLKQQQLPLEVLVVNDGSTDDSLHIIKKHFGDKVVRVISIENGGVSRARNIGVQMARGNWVAFLDSDDTWETNHLQEICTLSTIYPDSKVLVSGYRFVVGANFRYPRLTIPFKDSPGRIEINNYFKLAYNSDPPLWTGALVVSKSAFMNSGGFHEDVRSGEDLLLWAKLSLSERIVIGEKVTANYFLDESYGSLRKSKRIPSHRDIVGEELKKMQYYGNKRYVRKYLSLWYKMRAHECFKSGMLREGFRESLYSIKYDIFNFKMYRLILYYSLINLCKNVI